LALCRDIPYGIQDKHCHLQATQRCICCIATSCTSLNGLNEPRAIPTQDDPAKGTTATNAPQSRQAACRRKASVVILRFYQQLMIASNTVSYVSFKSYPGTQQWTTDINTSLTQYVECQILMKACSYNRCYFLARWLAGNATRALNTERMEFRLKGAGSRFDKSVRIVHSCCHMSICASSRMHFLIGVCKPVALEIF